jgi:primosomal protein N' (replication factor Y)
VATPKLFRLKAEVAPAPSGPIASVLPYARVRVDTGVFHLDQLYDYKVPEKLSESTQVGVRVQLPFGNRETEGIVVERVAQPERAGELKSITKVLPATPVATAQSLHVIDLISQHYACNPWDLIRSAIPPRVASVDKSIQGVIVDSSKNSKRTIEFQTLAPFIQAHNQVVQLVQENQGMGSILIVAPDEKDVDLIIGALTKFGLSSLKLTAAMPREDRYRNYLEAMRRSISIVVGTRSAIFAPVNNLTTVIIHKESSLDHYEVRSPGWNTRTVALIRSEVESFKLVLTGFSPSIEVAQLIDEREVKYLNAKESVTVKAFTPSEGALLPGRIFTDVKKALTTGPVLFIAPRKGYGNALLCAHCRNVAACECGGRLSVSGKGKAPSCVHCGNSFPAWKCSFCNRDKQYLAGRGIERAAEEISRAFPNFPVVISAGEVIKDRIEAKPALVLATPGAQPQVEGGYAAVVILEGLRFFAHTDLRTQERARELFLETSSLISSEGSVLLVIDDSHPIVSAIARWNIAPLLKRELSDRLELKLPPSVFSVVLVMDQAISMQIANGLKKAAAEGRIPPSSCIYGPTEISKGQVKIVIHADKKDASALTHSMHELQRRRSIAKKELFTLRVEPYSL